jgi:PAS domain S-box-containing protein
MKDQSKTKPLLIQELVSLKQRIKEFEQSESERKRNEEALRRAEENFRRSLDDSPLGIRIVTIDGETIYANRAILDIYSYEDLKTIPLKKRYTPESYAEYKIRRRKRKRGDYAPSEYEISIIRKDGEVRNLQVYRKEILWDGERQFQVTYQDITDRKRAEEALRKSEANYRQLFDNSPTGIYQVDFRTGKFLKANDAFCEYLGYSQKEITSLSPYDILTNESKHLFSERLNKMILGDKVPENPEFEIINRNGQRKWVQLNTKFIYDSEGLAGADVVAHDITDRKLTEEALRESEEKYRNLVESISDVIYEIDSQGVVIYISPVIKDVMGADQADIVGKNFIEFVYKDDKSRLIERFFELSEGIEYPFEYRLISKSGDIRWVRSKTSSIMEGGSFKGARGTLIDITERKRAEEEMRSLVERLQRAEKMEALGTLAGGVAHDLNNVLGVVIGYSELLLIDADKSRSISPSLVKIMNGAQRAAAIVQDLLTLARRGVSGREVLNLNKIIVDCQQSPEFEKLSSYHPSVKIESDLEPYLLNISGSSVHLGKTLFNLVSNATEAMPKGGILTIKTANQYLDNPIQGYDEIREGDYVVLSVSDTGEGIPAADLKRIFEPFYTKKVMGRSGTGLGLAVVWGTVKDHNGYINVESEEGKGSTFTIYFPVTREDITAEAAAISISEYMGKGESILIVDDVKEQCDLAAGMLGKLNYNVASVSSGEEAIAHLKDQAVDLIVLDMIMDPGMDGLNTYRNVLEIHPKQKAIIVSGFSESDRVITAQALGAGAYVRKPYVIEKLGLAVKKELDRK